MEKELTYPCQYCGCCSVWLASGEEGSGLDTLEKVFEACKKYYNCPLPGTKVKREEC